MSSIGRIKVLLECAESLATSGMTIVFHLGLTAPEFLFQTYPKAWTKTYAEKGYVMIDPIVRWGNTETGSIRWSSLRDADEGNILDQALKFGLAYGLAVATDSNNSRSFAGFSRPDREFSDGEVEQLSLWFQELHDLTSSTNGMDPALHTELEELSAKMARSLET